MRGDQRCLNQWQWYSPVEWLVWQPLESVPPLWAMAAAEDRAITVAIRAAESFFMFKLRFDWLLYVI